MNDLRLPFEDSVSEGTDGDREARQAAVDATQSVALSASAGTGKTQVLVDRYVNLLRAHVSPSNILAITFTRKAAAEMRQRILKRVREAAMEGGFPATQWRELRDHLDEIAISTIDAFCLSLLREFPIEADLDPGFEVADETEVPRLVDDALDRALRICRALAREDESVGLVFAQRSEPQLRTELATMLERRLGRVPRVDLTMGSADLTVHRVSRELLSRLQSRLITIPGGLEKFLADGPVRHPRYALLRRDVLDLCGGGNLVSAVERFAAPSRFRPFIDAIAQHFLTRDGAPRRSLSPYRKDDCDSAHAWTRHQLVVCQIAPEVADQIRTFNRQLVSLTWRGLLRIFHIAEHEYRGILRDRGVLDFPELLARAIALLEGMDEFAVSRYRLEARYHHLLIDEFQDTSPAQWKLVRLLVRSWMEGEGLAADAPLQPTIFIVGDPKQSIYGFRDADVTVFRKAASWIERLRPRDRVKRAIARNFRSVPALLSFVNDLFTAIEKVDSREDAFSFAEDDRFPETSMTDTNDQALGLAIGEEHEQVALAVADEIQRLLDTTDVRDVETGLARRVKPSDIAILFRSRESHREFEAALEARGIGTYVYKGLGFFDSDEVKDLQAILRYLADTTSDLRAAALMRSRFIRLSDPAVQALAPNLAAALQPALGHSTLDVIDEEDRRVLEQARRGLSRWIALVDRIPPSELLDRILAESAYAVELAGPRLRQARENLKKFRGVVRLLENRGYVTLRRIADHLDRLSVGDESNAVIDATNAVSLMTVHASKGLEFPVVFLVNLTRGTSGRRLLLSPVAMGDAEPEDGLAEPDRVQTEDFEPETEESAQAREREETKRLLYVATTRARDRLYLSAVVKDNRRVAFKGSLAEVLPPAFREVLIQGLSGSGPVAWVGPSGGRHLFRVCRPGGTLETGRRDSPPREPTQEATDDFGPLAETRSIQRRTVTAASGSETGPVQDTGELAAMVEADRDPDPRLIGRLVHRLLQLDAGLTGSENLPSAERVLSLIRPEESVTVADAGRLVDAVAQTFAALRSHPEVVNTLQRGEAFFEVPFSFRRDRTPPVILRGTIDCLVQDAHGKVTVLEFKTGARRPEHDTQLGMYVEAARQLFGDHNVGGLLVYTV